MTKWMWICSKINGRFSLYERNFAAINLYRQTHCISNKRFEQYQQVSLLLPLLLKSNPSATTSMLRPNILDSALDGVNLIVSLPTIFAQCRRLPDTAISGYNLFRTMAARRQGWTWEGEVSASSMWISSEAKIGTLLSLLFLFHVWHSLIWYSIFVCFLFYFPILFLFSFN